MNEWKENIRNWDFLYLFVDRNMKEAADQAFEMRNEDDLIYVLGKVKVSDRQLAENVRQMLGQLSSRR